MHPDLTNYLTNRFPDIFATIKCFPCGDGWFYIIHDLCGCIESHERALKLTYDRRKKSLEGSDARPDPLPCPVEASDVKEKWGSLCFYTSGGTNYIDGAIDLAERLSERICERCGSAAKTRPDRSWVATLCDQCNKNEEEGERRNELLVANIKSEYLENSNETATNKE